MSTRTIVLGGALAFALSGLASQSTAAVYPAVDFTFPGQYTLSNCCWTLGYAFTAKANTWALGLATWNMWEPGVEAQADVGLWDANGNLLDSVSVTDASPTTGIANWSYTQFASPIALAAGETYYVGSYGAAADYTFEPAGFSVDFRIAYVRNAYIYNPGALAFPSNWEGLNRPIDIGFLGGNVVFAPEISTWAMMIVGFAGLAVFSYRASRRSAPAA
jgi:hypothetical protein